MTVPEARPVTGTARIRWQPTDFGGFTGHVGTNDVAVFRLWQCDKHDAEWTLAADLPGESIPGSDPDDLKAEAERWLEEFVTSLGAIFPAGSSDEPEAKTATAGEE